MEENYQIETKCIQSGWKPTKGEPRVLPIYQSTTFKYDTSDQMGRLFDLEEAGYFYTRLQNPTNDAVAAKIADLEGGIAAMLTSSGQAANYFAVFNICEAGDHIVASSSLYVEPLICWEPHLRNREFPVPLWIRMHRKKSFQRHFYQIPRR